MSRERKGKGWVGERVGVADPVRGTLPYGVILQKVTREPQVWRSCDKAALVEFSGSLPPSPTLIHIPPPLILLPVCPIFPSLPPLPATYLLPMSKVLLSLVFFFLFPTRLNFPFQTNVHETDDVRRNNFTFLCLGWFSPRCLYLEHDHCVQSAVLLSHGRFKVILGPAIS